MTNQKTVLVLYGDPSRKVLLQQYNTSDLPFQINPHHVDPALSIGDQLAGIRERINDSSLPVEGTTVTSEFTSVLAAIINAEAGFNGPSLRSVYHAQNKALFAQHAAFCNPHFPPTKILASGEDVPQGQKWYPGFMKPAAGSLSNAAYQVDNPTDALEKYTRAASLSRTDVLWREAIFQPVVQAGDPALSSFMLQPFQDFPQYTVDGYVFDGQVHWVGITESVFDQAGHSFERFDFPANLAKNTTDELHQVIERVINRINYDMGFFNVEFFVNDEGHIILIEFNTRLAFQFIPLYAARYRNNIFIESCRLTLGEAPQLEPITAEQMASSCVLRLYHDAKVFKTPTRTECQSVIEEGLADSVRVIPQAGKRLSDYKQDQYSFRYAIINIRGKDRVEIDKKLAEVKNRLTFVFS
ncbi:MAG: ATP-grasp domain-containing protein [Brevefilum sp.]